MLVPFLFKVVCLFKLWRDVKNFGDTVITQRAQSSRKDSQRIKQMWGVDVVLLMDFVGVKNLKRIISWSFHG